MLDQTAEKTTPLKDAYNSLSKSDADEARKNIIKICGINYTIFFNWINGITPVPKLARIIVSNYLKKTEYELFAEQLKSELHK